MRYALVFLLSALFAAPLRGQNIFVGQYSGQYNGDPVTMTLQGTTAALTGELNDGSNLYAITAKAAGNVLTGQAVEKTMNLTFALQGTLAGAQLTLNLTFNLLGQTNTQTVVLTKQKATAQVAPANSTATTAGKPAPGQRDPAVTGTWVKESIINSGYGDQFASATTVQSLTFNANGTLRDEGSRTVTGGSNFSGDTGTSAAKEVPGVTWYTENKNIYLIVTENGKTQTVKLGRYFIENGKMLITGDNGKKELFYKR
jgi:hypothetical protein